MKQPKFLHTLRKPLPETSVEELRAALEDATAELAHLEAAAEAAAQEAVTGDYAAAESAATKAFADISLARFRRDALARRLEAAEAAERDARRKAELSALEAEAAELAAAQERVRGHLRGAAERILEGYQSFITAREISADLAARVSAHAAKCQHLETHCTIPITPELTSSDLEEMLFRLGAPTRLRRAFDANAVESREMLESAQRQARRDLHDRLQQTIEVCTQGIRYLEYTPLDRLGMEAPARDARIQSLRASIEQAKAELAKLADLALQPPMPLGPPAKITDATIDGDATPLEDRLPSHLPVALVADLRGDTPTRRVPLAEYEAQQQAEREAEEKANERATEPQETTAEAEADGEPEPEP